MSKTYIHIGYPKNASTTLQTDIFPNIKNSFFLGRSYNTEHSFYSQEISDLMYSITMLDSIDCPLDDLKMKFSDALEAIDQEKIIISSEGFSNNFCDRGVMANRLHAIFPQAKILVVIRNQIDSLLSMYGFLVRQLGENVNVSYGRPSIDSMEKWISDQEKFIGRSYITSLQYSKLIDGYSKLFGKENITVLLFEELVQEPASFFSKVYDFFDVKDDFNKNRALPKKRNTKPSNRELFYYKLRTKLPNAELSKYVPNIIIKVWRKYLYAGSTKRTIDELPLEMKNRLISMYSLDNKKLQEQLNLDLKKYGYKI